MIELQKTRPSLLSTTSPARPQHRHKISAAHICSMADDNELSLFIKEGGENGIVFSFILKNVNIRVINDG